MSEKLQKNKAYPLVDFHPLMSHHPLVSVGMTSFDQRPKLGAAWTGEKRPPKAGEWFLSGSVIEAYQAKHDLLYAYPIARIVKVKVTTLETFVDVDHE